MNINETYSEKNNDMQVKKIRMIQLNRGFYVEKSLHFY